MLEITESTLIENPELVSAVLDELLALGVAIQLDDFGTGYSSLTVLHDFPGDTLKIDRSFVATMIAPRSQAIIRSIIGLAHNLGLRVIAEGIDNAAQLDTLQRWAASTPRASCCPSRSTPRGRSSCSGSGTTARRGLSRSPEPDDYWQRGFVAPV